MFKKNISLIVLFLFLFLIFHGSVFSQDKISIPNKLQDINLSEKIIDKLYLLLKNHEISYEDVKKIKIDSLDQKLGALENIENSLNKKFYDDDFSKISAILIVLLGNIKKFLGYMPPDGYDEACEVLILLDLPDALKLVGSLIFYFLGAITLIYFMKYAYEEYQEAKNDGRTRMYYRSHLMEMAGLFFMASGLVAFAAFVIISIYIPPVAGSFLFGAVILYDFIPLTILCVGNLIMIIMNIFNLMNNIEEEFREKVEEINFSKINDSAKNRMIYLLEVDKKRRYIESYLVILFQGMMLAGVIVGFFFPIMQPLVIVGGIGTIIVLMEKFAFTRINYLKNKLEIPGIHFDEDENKYDVKSSSSSGKKHNKDIQEKESNTKSDSDSFRSQSDNYSTESIVNYINQEDLQKIFDKFILIEFIKEKMNSGESIDMNFFENKIQTDFHLFFYRMLDGDQSLIFMEKYIRKGLENIKKFEKLYTTSSISNWKKRFIFVLKILLMFGFIALALSISYYFFIPFSVFFLLFVFTNIFNFNDFIDKNIIKNVPKENKFKIINFLLDIKSEKIDKMYIQELMYKVYNFNEHKKNLFNLEFNELITNIDILEDGNLWEYYDNILNNLFIFMMKSNKIFRTHAIDGFNKLENIKETKMEIYREGSKVIIKYNSAKFYIFEDSFSSVFNFFNIFTSKYIKNTIDGLFKNQKILNAA